MKIYKFKRQEHGDKNFPCLVDPTRGLNGNDKFYLFPAHDISMHHMSSIRKDLSKKYTNSNLIHNSHTTDKTAKEVFNLQQSILDFDFHKNQEMLKEYSMFDKSLIRKVENEFNIVIKN